MKKDATLEQIEHMVGRVQQLGMKPHVINGTERTVIAVVGDDRKTHKESLESGPGVAEVVPILAPYKIASREVQSEPTVVRAGSLTVGGGTVGIIAGPCSVESEEQILATAKAVKAAGATALRGGAFKPRTSPYSFQGLKEEGLKMLATARDATGLAIVTEVMANEDMDLVARYADVLQIGARNMQNYRLLEAAGKTDRPVLLKRGPSATVEELLLAAEYILDAGNQQVMLCERGIRTFENHTRFTLPLGHGGLSARQDAPADCGRPQSRHRAHLAGAADVRRQRRRRRGRADHRSASRSGKCALRRQPVVGFRSVSPDDGNVPQSCRRTGPQIRQWEMTAGWL